MHCLSLLILPIWNFKNTFWLLLLCCCLRALSFFVCNECNFETMPISFVFQERVVRLLCYAGEMVVSKNLICFLRNTYALSVITSSRSFYQDYERLKEDVAKKVCRSSDAFPSPFEVSFWLLRIPSKSPKQIWETFIDFSYRLSVKSELYFFTIKTQVQDVPNKIPKLS